MALHNAQCIQKSWKPNLQQCVKIMLANQSVVVFDAMTSMKKINQKEFYQFKNINVIVFIDFQILTLYKKVCLIFGAFGIP